MWSKYFASWMRLKPTGETKPFQRQTRAFEQASILIFLFYVLNFINLKTIFKIMQNSTDVVFLDPQWPIAFLEWLAPGYTTAIVGTTAIAGTVLAAFFWRHRAPRILFAVGLLLFVAFENSFGKVNHGSHLALLISIGLIFLPSKRVQAKRGGRQQFLTVIVAVQGMILMAYTMAGFWKVVALFDTQLPTISLMHLDGFQNQIAASLIEKRKMTELGLFLIQHQWLAWAVGLTGVFVEFLAFAAILRPRLQQIFGYGLVFLHAGAIVIMSISFNANMIWLTLFLVASPFAPSFKLGAVLRELPPWGWFLNDADTREEAIMPAERARHAEQN